MIYLDHQTKISVLLIKICHFKENGVDIKLQCDDEKIFQKILDGMPYDDKWHYKKSMWAYRTIKRPKNINMPVAQWAADYIRAHILDMVDAITYAKVFVKIQIDGKTRSTHYTEESFKILSKFFSNNLVG